jgi:hypothetical protein
MTNQGSNARLPTVGASNYGVIQLATAPLIEIDEDGLFQSPHCT